MLWHIGNTTVRTPYRLRDALEVLHDSPLHGNISDREQEHAFAELLHNKGVLHAPRILSGRDASDLGRKWRVALSQLGFITPKLKLDQSVNGISKESPSLVSNFDALANRPFVLTPNGFRLLRADLISNQQDCFLRSLASYRIPSPIELHYKSGMFSPLRFVLNVIHSLSEAGLDPRLSFHEFALFVQTSTPSDGIGLVVEKLKKYREVRDKAKGSVKRYDREIYEFTAKRVNRVEDTLKDYADLSFRYLKSTGLFRSAGRGIAISSSRTQLAAYIREELDDSPVSDNEYLDSLWNGAILPTDHVDYSYAVVLDLAQKLKCRGVDVEIPTSDAPLIDLEYLRHLFEERILQLDELAYADQQSEELDEILAWIKAISTRGRSTLPDGSIVSVPNGEAPVYLEWIIWRAVLAIDSLFNKPWEARRFEIDQDFLPVHCAPGNGPDMVFEFEDAVIVVEVTLTSSSRQEAAEGEPVRRHVAQFVEQSQKPVFGLFIAVNIDSNTANTFRSGDWFLKDDKKINLSIVPLTLSDFAEFLSSGRTRLSEMPQLLKQLIIECRSLANQEAPAWKRAISKTVRTIVEKP